MRQFALTLALLGWFFMFKVPHPELKGITVSVLVGIFKDEQSCREEWRKVDDDLGGLPNVVVTECELAEDI